MWSHSPPQLQLLAHYHYFLKRHARKTTSIHIVAVVEINFKDWLSVRSVSCIINDQSERILPSLARSHVKHFLRLVDGCCARDLRIHKSHLHKNGAFLLMASPERDRQIMRAQRAHCSEPLYLKRVRHMTKVFFACKRSLMKHGARYFCITICLFYVSRVSLLVCAPPREK